MNLFKKIVGYIILIPNITFMLGMSIYVMVKIFKHNSLTDISTMDEKDIVDDENIIQFVADSYPLWLEVFVAAFIYTCLIFAFFI